jgi:hypothetical protein
MQVGRQQHVNRIATVVPHELEKITDGLGNAMTFGK